MDALIQFFSEGVDFKIESEKAVIQWLLDTVSSEGRQAAVINIIFCNDEYLLDLNQRFLDRDTLTDVIAFDYHEEDKEASGDIFISIERISDNAGRLSLSFEEELYRVLVHGILHLCGLSDATADEKAFMTSKEDKYLSLLAF
jgi:rRNA maturation RNase YbeY